MALNPGLRDQSYGADRAYGFPSGTLWNLALTESNAGQNTGKIGNIFQILPTTAANPGYGLGPLDGNNPYDAGAYLSALTARSGGDLSSGLAAYHGGLNNPTPYAASSPIGGFLQQIRFMDNRPGLGVTDNPMGDPNSFNDLPFGIGDTLGTIVGGATALATNGVDRALTWIQELALRVMLVVVGIVLLAGGLYIAGVRTSGLEVNPKGE